MNEWYWNRLAEEDNDRLARQVLDMQRRRTGNTDSTVDGGGSSTSDEARIAKLQSMLVVAAQREVALVEKHVKQEKQWQAMYKQWMQEMEIKIKLMAAGDRGRGSEGTHY